MPQKNLYLSRALNRATLISTDNQHTTYRIGDLAREFDLTLRTLRFYEDKGLVTPRRSGTTRLYSSEDRARLKLILFSKKAGFSLLEIRELLHGYNARNELNNPLANSKNRFEKKLGELRQQRVEIEKAIDELSQQLQSDTGLFAN